MSYSLVGSDFDNGYLIDYGLGASLVKAYLPEKDLTYIKSFTVVVKNDRVLLVAKLINGIVDFTLNLEPSTLSDVSWVDDDENVLEVPWSSIKYRAISEAALGVIGIFIVVALWILIRIVR